MNQATSKLDAEIEIELDQLLLYCAEDYDDLKFSDLDPPLVQFTITLFFRLDSWKGKVLTHKEWYCHSCKTDCTEPVSNKFYPFKPARRW